MKTMAAITVVLLFSFSAVSAQEDHRSINVSVFYPLSTNKSKEISTDFNLTLLYGNVGYVKVLDLSAVTSIVNYDLKGVQLSGVFSYVGRDMVGVQWSVVNYLGGGFKGLESGVVNYVEGDFKGVQSATVNYVGGDFKGLQTAVVNYAGGYCEGLQTGTVNLAGADKTGEYLFKGLQAGVVNIADNVDGGQLGVVNISKNMEGFPVGLVNYAQNAQIEAVVFRTNLSAWNIGYKFTLNRFYSLFSLGRKNLEEDIDESYSLGYHFGLHLPVSSFYLDADIGWLSFHNDKLFENFDEAGQEVLQVRGITGYAINRLSLFGGVGLSCIMDEGEMVGYGEYKPLYVGGGSICFQ